MRRLALFLCIALVAVMALHASGCAPQKLPWGRQSTGSEAPATLALVKWTPPAIDYAKIRPNELGHIPIIMYHEIGGTPVASDPHLVRSAPAFRQDLEQMYAAGFRPVNLADVLNNTIDLPAGTSPIVLTFDDARESQFRLIDGETTRKIDPDCALGILDAFHKRRPDWPLRATFFVMPRSEKTVEPFGQPAMGAGDDKMRWIVAQGMEIGNHTIHHRSLRTMTAEQIQAEIGGAHNRILRAVPDAKLQVVALPMGQYPRDAKNVPYLVKGTYQGVAYEYKAVMKAAYRPVVSPASTQFDPMTLERIGPSDGRHGVRWWLQTLAQNSRYPRYVSDGDPRVISFPKNAENLVDVAKLNRQNKRAYAYEPFGGSGGFKPIVGAEAAPQNPGTTKPIL